MKPSAEDWIILRLIIVRVGPDRFTLQSHSDASKAIDYLFKKLGDKTMNEMIDQLTEEPI